jgi:hypothetical protein
VWADVLSARGVGSVQRITGARIANVETRLLVVDARGDAVIAWETRPLPKPTAGELPPGTLYVAYRDAGGRFGVPHRIARRTEGADVGIDARGAVTIAWDQAAAHGHKASLEVVQRRRDGRYSTATRVAHGAVIGLSLAVYAREARVGDSEGCRHRLTVCESVYPTPAAASSGGWPESASKARLSVHEELGSGVQRLWVEPRHVSPRFDSRSVRWPLCVEVERDGAVSAAAAVERCGCAHAQVMLAAS